MTVDSINTTDNIKIAYIHATSFPSAEANTFDAMWSSAALSQFVDTTFFMPRLNTSKASLKRYYEITEANLRLQSMYLNYIPDRILLKTNNYYEKTLSAYLRFHPKWAGFQGKKVIYAREPKELLFWGLNKQRQSWLKEWVLCYEAHDPLGMDPNEFYGTNPFALRDGSEGQRRQEILEAAQNFDILICNTQTLADDIRSWTNGVLKPHFIMLASPLPRLAEPPQIHSFGDNVILGYIGTIDQYRGVNILFEAMRFLPENYHLRIVGRHRKEKDIDPNWINRYMQDPQIGPKVDLNIVDSIQNVAAEIDQCDIVIQPASMDVVDSQYAAPLKSFGYMVRGKPIIAGDVPCHRELFKNGKSAALYTLDPQELASCVLNLTNDPKKAENIAQEAWEQAGEYNYRRRAENILALIRDRC